MSCTAVKMLAIYRVAGLGLALVQRIIELHRGSVEVHSRPEQGTMVRVRLPANKN